MSIEAANENESGVYKEEKPQKSDRRKSEVFPHIEQYEADPVIKERRERLLQIISIFDEAGRAFYNEKAERTLSSASPEMQLTTLKELTEPIHEWEEAGQEYLSQFEEDDKLLPGSGKHLNGEAIKSPQIMTGWIGGELISMVNKLSTVKTVNQFYATIGALTFFRRVLDVEE